jgi:hypothetical protein
MFSLKSLFSSIKKEERSDGGYAFAEPVLSSLEGDISKIDSSFSSIKHLVDSGFRIGFDKIPSIELGDLIEKVKEFSAIVEASDVGSRIQITALLARMHDSAVKCSGFSAFLVDSAEPNINLNKLLACFGEVKDSFKEVRALF